MRDLLTIAIPVFNRERYFREALESALRQTVPARVMVVDNASTSCDFRKIISEYGPVDVVYHRNLRNLGMYPNWNQCISLCPTPYVLILHDDDVLERDYVQQFSLRFDRSVDFFWCKVSLIDAEGNVTRKEALEYDKFSQIEEWCTHNGAYQGVILRCSKALELGMFSPRIRYISDWDLYVKFILFAKSQFLPVIGVRYRSSPLNETASAVRDYRYFTTARLLIKRNFYRAGLWREYQQVRFTVKLPVPGLEQVFGFLPQLSPRRLAYFCRLLVLAPAPTKRRVATKWLIRLIGWRGIHALGTIWRWWHQRSLRSPQP